MGLRSLVPRIGVREMRIHCAAGDQRYQIGNAALPEFRLLSRVKNAKISPLQTLALQVFHAELRRTRSATKAHQLAQHP